MVESSITYLVIVKCVDGKEERNFFKVYKDEVFEEEVKIENVKKYVDNALYFEHIKDFSNHFHKIFNEYRGTVYTKTFVLDKKDSEEILKYYQEKSQGEQKSV